MNLSYKEKLYILDEINCYKILGLEGTCDVDSISKKYRELAKSFHPDANHGISEKDKNEINRLFQKITNAFNILKDPEERKKHDHELNILKFKNKPINEPKKVNNTESSQFSFTFSQVKYVDPKEVQKEREKKELELAENRLSQAKKYIDEDRNDEAIAILRDLVEKYNTNASYHSYLGLAMHNKGWTGYAQAEFKVSLHYNPNDEIALKYRTANFTPPKVVTKLDSKNNDKDSGLVSKIKSLFSK